MISGYCPARRNLKVMLRENEYFGNQHIQPLIEDLAEEMVQYRQTPLDDRALQIFNEEIFRAIENNVDSQKTIKDIANKVEYELKKDREAYLREKAGKIDISLHKRQGERHYDNICGSQPRSGQNLFC